MSKFFRADSPSDSEDAPLPCSPVPGPNRDRGRIPGTDSDSDSDSDVPHVAPGPEDLIDHPALPVPDVAKFLDYVLGQAYPIDCTDREAAIQLARVTVDKFYRFRQARE